MVKRKESGDLMWNNLFLICACHLFGDYVLQSDFIAKTKGENWYHLFIHSVLYSIPFAFCFGIDFRIAIIVISHFIIDVFKARYKFIGYVEDQILHYVVGLRYYLF